MRGIAPPQILGRYAIYDKIASGGMASVHFGRLLGEAGFARTVAIKRLHPHLAEEPSVRSTLIDEARLAARIHHPNVVPTLDVVTTGNEVLVVMEYVRGESLSKLFRTVCERGRRVPFPMVSAICAGALHGLHAAHEATSDRGEPLGIVHRDVSPQNILVGVDGVARVIDFGVAKAAGRLQVTREGTVKGKIAYMAPEQLAGLETTRQVDVYGLAVVMWELLAGRPLFEGDTDAARMRKVLTGAEEPPSYYAPGIPPALDELVMTGLAKEPCDRFATARDMADALVRAVPPALAPDVGAWVDETAHGTLARRGVVLAEIESQSRMASVENTDDDATIVDEQGAPMAEPQEVSLALDPPIAASELSSLSVETPKDTLATAPRSRRTAIVVAGGAAAMLAIGVAAFTIADRGAPAARPAGQSDSSERATGASTTVPESVPPSAPLPAASATTIPRSAADAGPSPPVSPNSGRPAAPARSPRKPAAAPAPAPGRGFDPASVR